MMGFMAIRGRKFKPNDVEFRSDGSVALTLTRADGTEIASAIVDREDYERIRHRRWILNSKGYVVTNARGGEPSARLHRYILGVSDESQVDHVDLDKLNNRRANLRLASNSQNNANGKPRAWKFKGVRATESGRFLARAGVTRNGEAQTYMLGTYDTPEEAARAYDAFARQEWGEFARLNFPDGC